MRSKNAYNIHYKYQLTLGDDKYLFRSMNHMVENLPISKSTTQRMIKDMEYIPRKFRNKFYHFKKVHIPIYQKTKTKIDYQTINESFNEDLSKLKI